MEHHHNRSERNLAITVILNGIMLAENLPVSESDAITKKSKATVGQPLLYQSYYFSV